MKTEILNAPRSINEKLDTTRIIVRSDADTTKKDEPRITIGFNPSVEDWE